MLQKIERNFIYLEKISLSTVAICLYVLDNIYMYDSLTKNKILSAYQPSQDVIDATTEIKEYLGEITDAPISEYNIVKR